MKRILSYQLLIVALILSVAAVSANVWENNFTIKDNLPTNVSSDADPLDNEYSFTMLDTPFIPVGLNKVSNPRLPITVVKAEYNPYYMLRSYFSQLTQRQLTITRLSYVSLFSKMEKDGYYIYALRKLLI